MNVNDCDDKAFNINCGFINKQSMNPVTVGHQTNLVIYKVYDQIKLTDSLLHGILLVN